MLAAKVEGLLCCVETSGIFKSNSRLLSIGILESLWHWSARYAIQGDIGKWSDNVIAKGIGWSGDSHELIKALVESRLIDSVGAPHRLVIHDIQQHADNTWKQNLVDAGLTWWDGTSPRLPNKGRPKKHTPEEFKLNARKCPQPLSDIQYPEPLLDIQSQDCCSSKKQLELVHGASLATAKKTINGLRAEQASRFELFWSDYPRKVGKKAAVRAFANALRSEPESGRIIAALQRQKEDLVRDGMKFCPHPATWLNEARWEDEPDASKQARGPSQSSDRRANVRAYEKYVPSWKDGPTGDSSSSISEKEPETSNEFTD